MSGLFTLLPRVRGQVSNPSRERWGRCGDLVDGGVDVVA
jgi:hypothetical protein